MPDNNEFIPNLTLDPNGEAAAAAVQAEAPTLQDTLQAEASVSPKRNRRQSTILRRRSI